MARADSETSILIQQHGKYKFIQKISFTGVGAATTIAATAFDGTPVGAGSKIALQTTTTVLYQLIPVGAVSSVTQATDAQPGKPCSTAGDSFYMLPTDAQFDVVSQGAAGTINLYLVV